MKTVLLVGLGRQMRQNIHPAVMDESRFRIVACYDKDAGSTTECAAKWGVRAVGTSELERAIDEVDAVITALPANETSPYLELATKKRKILFVEKPALLRSNELGAWLAAPGAENVLVGYNFLFADALTALAKRLADQESRGPKHCHLTFLSKHPGPGTCGISDGVEAWLRLNGVHPVSIASFLLGPFADIDVVRTWRLDTGFRILCRILHQSGDVTSLTIGSATPAFRFNITIEMPPDTEFQSRGLSRLYEIDHRRQTRQALHIAKELSTHQGSGYAAEISALLDPAPLHNAARLDAARNYLLWAETLLERL